MTYFIATPSVIYIFHLGSLFTHSFIHTNQHTRPFIISSICSPFTIKKKPKLSFLWIFKGKWLAKVITFLSFFKSCLLFYHFSFVVWFFLLLLVVASRETPKWFLWCSFMFSVASIENLYSLFGHINREFNGFLEESCCWTLNYQ